MDKSHFELFFAYVSGIYREIHRLMSHFANVSGVKSVYIFWLYLLLERPEGLTAAELAEASHTTSSLVSREISELVDCGLICTDVQTERRRYAWKFRLTEKGREIAERIDSIAVEIRNSLSMDIPAEELDTFYSVFGKLYDGFNKLEEDNFNLIGGKNEFKNNN